MSSKVSTCARCDFDKTFTNDIDHSFRNAASRLYFSSTGNTYYQLGRLQIPVVLSEHELDYLINLSFM